MASQCQLCIPLLYWARWCSGCSVVNTLIYVAAESWMIPLRGYEGYPRRRFWKQIRSKSEPDGCMFQGFQIACYTKSQSLEPLPPVPSVWPLTLLAALSFIITCLQLDPVNGVACFAVNARIIGGKNKHSDIAWKIDWALTRFRTERTELELQRFCWFSSWKVRKTQYG